MANNASGFVLPSSTITCSNTYDCQQKMCIMKNYSDFNTVEIMPDWDAWNNNCNLTIRDSFVYVYQRYKFLYWTCFTSNIITLITVVICYFINLHVYMVIYLMTIAVICLNMVDNYSKDYVINWMGYYQQVHNVLS